MKNKLKIFIGILIALFSFGILIAQAAPQYIFQNTIVPSTTNTYYLGSTSPNLEWNGIYTKNLNVTGTCTGCGGGSGTNYFTNSGANTYLNTGSNLEAPFFTSTSTTNTNTFAGKINNTSTSNSTFSGALQYTGSTANAFESTGSPTTGLYIQSSTNGVNANGSNYGVFGNNSVNGAYGYLGDGINSAGVTGASGGGSYAGYFLGSAGVNTYTSYIGDTIDAAAFYGTDGTNFGYVGSNSLGAGLYGSGTSYGVFGTGPSIGVDADNSASGGQALYANQGNSTGYAIYANGGENYFSDNVGIGSTTPGTRLSLGTSGGINFNPTATSTYGSSANGINLTHGCFAISGTCVGGGSSQWTTSGSDIYYSTGHVGIGTTPGTASLDILNDSVNDGFQIRHSNLSQGIGIGFNTIQSLGTNVNVDLGLSAKGTGNIVFGSAVNFNGNNITTTGGLNIGVGSGGYTGSPNYSQLDGIRISGNDQANTIWDSFSGKQLSIETNAGDLVLGTAVSTANLVIKTGTGNVGIASTTPTHTLSIGNYISADSTGALNIGYSPITIYQDSFGSLVHLTGNPSSYFPRMLNVNYAPADNTAFDLGDQETGSSYELPVNGGCWNGNSYNCAQGLEMGSQRYTKVGTNYYSNINYINAYKRTTGTTTPIAISFENKDLNTFETRYVAAYFDPSGATAIGGYASTTSNSANRYDLTIPFQVGSSTASTLFAVDSTPRTHVFQVSSAGVASTTNLTISGVASCSGSNALTTNASGVVACGAISGGGGINYLTNSGSNTYLNTGTNLQAPTLNATSTTGTSTFSGGIAGTNNFTVQSSTGNVGIGTSSPLQALTLLASGGNNAVESLVNTNSGGTEEVWLGATGGSSEGFRFKHYNSAIGFGLNNTGEFWNFDSSGNAGIRLGGSGGEVMRIDTINTRVGIGTSTTNATFQATAAASNATTSVQFGKANQNKGTCMTLYRTDGTPIYAYVAAGATAFTLTTTQPSGCQN